MAGQRGTVWIARRWLPALVLVCALAAIWASGLTQWISLATILREHEHLESWFMASRALFVLAYVATYVVVVSLSIPGAALCTLVAGYVFGWLAGGLLAVVSATAGATVLFLVARTSLGAALRQQAGPHLRRIAAGFRDDALSYLLFLRLVPLFPFWLVNIAPAVLGVRLNTFVIGTFFGIIPGTFVYASIGAGLDSLIEAQEAANPGCSHAGSCVLDLAALVTPAMVGALVALGLLSLLPVALKRLRRSRP